MSSNKKEKEARFLKLMPGIPKYIEQTASEGVACESSAGLFNHPFTVFPPSSLDETNYDMIPGKRFLCVIATRACTPNGRRLFPTRADMFAWIDFIQDVRGTTTIIGDIALEILYHFGEIDEEQYFEQKTAASKETRAFKLKSEDDEEADDGFGNKLPGEPEDDYDAEGSFEPDPTDRHTPSVDEARGN